MKARQRKHAIAANKVLYNKPKSKSQQDRAGVIAIRENVNRILYKTMIDAGKCKTVKEAKYLLRVQFGKSKIESPSKRRFHTMIRNLVRDSNPDWQIVGIRQKRHRVHVTLKRERPAVEKLEVRNTGMLSPSPTIVGSGATYAFLTWNKNKLKAHHEGT